MTTKLRQPATVPASFKQSKLTREMSRAARLELGLSQAATIAASGVKQHVLKGWEAGWLSAPAAELAKLREFYEREGADLDAIGRRLSLDHEATDAPPADERDDEPAEAREATPPPERDAPPADERVCFRVDPKLAAAEASALFDDMLANDERIASLMAKTARRSLFGAIVGDELTEESEADVQELIATLAWNYAAFLNLIGRGAFKATAEGTVGRFVADWVRQASPRGDAVAPAAQRALPAPAKVTAEPKLLTHAGDVYIDEEQ